MHFFCIFCYIGIETYFKKVYKVRTCLYPYSQVMGSLRSDGFFDPVIIVKFITFFYKVIFRFLRPLGEEIAVVGSGYRLNASLGF